MMNSYFWLTTISLCMEAKQKKPEATLIELSSLHRCVYVFVALLNCKEYFFLLFPVIK